MNDVILETHDLTKHYGGVFALEAADFTLNKSEHVAIMGDNGAGKVYIRKADHRSGTSHAGQYHLRWRGSVFRWTPGGT